jgi:uncharacterized protein (DUF2252 family)
MALDVVACIRAFNAEREPERLLLKYRKMRGSAFAFLRGSCDLYYRRLVMGGAIKSAPLSWACGDLHLENFGSYKADDRLVHFDINDFDEAALAPATWDLVRVLSSISVATKDMGLKRRQSQLLCATFLSAYLGALAAGKALWLERDNAHGLIAELLNSLRQRSRPLFLDSRSQARRGQRRLRVDGVKALPVSGVQHDAVLLLMRDFAKTQANPAFFRVLDVARRIAGTGSLGLGRYVVLVEGKGSPAGNYLLDLKQIRASCLLPHLKSALKVKQPRWLSQAQRVVSVAERMQAVPMAFTHTVQWHGGDKRGDQAWVLRGLQPSEDRIALATRQASTDQMQQLLGDLGRLLAWAQLRSAGRQGSANADELMAFAKSAQRPKWQSRLLDLAESGALQARQDAAEFNAAFDDHAFDDHAFDDHAFDDRSFAGPALEL